MEGSRVQIIGIIWKREVFYLYRGRSASCGGFIWKYKNKETPESGRKPSSKHKK